MRLTLTLRIGRPRRSCPTAVLKSSSGGHEKGDLARALARHPFLLLTLTLRIGRPPPFVPNGRAEEQQRRARKGGPGACDACGELSMHAGGAFHAPPALDQRARVRVRNMPARDTGEGRRGAWTPSAESTAQRQL